MPFGRCRPDAMTFTSRLPSRSRIAWTLSISREPTKTVPLSPTRTERAFATPLAKTSILKPCGTLSLPMGSRSAAVGIGGGAMGASLAAPSVSGRPYKAEPGAGGGDAAPPAGACGAWAAAPPIPNATKPANTKAPHVKRLVDIVCSLWSGAQPLVPFFGRSGRARNRAGAWPTASKRAWSAPRLVGDELVGEQPGGDVEELLALVGAGAAGVAHDARWRDVLERR